MAEGRVRSLNAFCVMNAADKIMELAGPTAGHDFGNNRVRGAGHRVRECLTERPELDNQPSSILTHFMGAHRRGRAGPVAPVGPQGPPTLLRFA